MRRIRAHRAARCQMNLRKSAISRVLARVGAVVARVASDQISPLERDRSEVAGVEGTIALCARQYRAAVISAVARLARCVAVRIDVVRMRADPLLPDDVQAVRTASQARGGRVASLAIGEHADMAL